MSESLTAAVMAHVWQSTLVIGVIWLATLALQTNRPRVRYWLWTAASVKFLVPFSWLVALGARFEWPTALPITQPAATFVMEKILTPPVVAAAAPAPTTQPAAAWPWGLASVWVLGCLIVLFWWWRHWRPVRTVLREAKPIELAPEHGLADLAVWSSASTFELGVVGVWHPVLLLPEGLVERLTAAQLKAVIAHERCHIRCHDNLVAAVHMVVEALFWFHPLVWWIEGRLIDERERACDEAVLHAGNDPADYAEGILTVFRFTVRAPLACVTGVTGADLRARIESIFRNELGAPMTLARCVAVAFFGVVLIGVPIVAGVVRIETPVLAVGQESSTPVFFEAAAVKPNKSGERAARIEEEPGGRYTAANASLRILILRAYQISENQLVGAPDWAQDERFDINAKLEREPPSVPRGQPGERLLALRSLLAERFKLLIHRETREFPMYALVMARADRKPGPLLKPSLIDCSPEATQARMAAIQAGKPVSGVCGRRVASGLIQFGGLPLSEFAGALSNSPDIGRSVVDRTGLTGNWDFELTYTPDRLPFRPPGQDPPAFDPNGPSLSTAMQEQLGLKLESIRGPMEVLVIDSVERPSPN
jgi:bla regulator protein BlaR1